MMRVHATIDSLDDLGCDIAWQANRAVNSLSVDVVLADGRAHDALGHRSLVVYVSSLTDWSLSELTQKCIAMPKTCISSIECAPLQQQPVMCPRDTTLANSIPIREREDKHMTATGDWTLHFNWGNTDNFAQTGINLKGDGTFSGPGPGNWHEHDGRILLSFDTGPAKYGGSVSDKVSSGAMSTFGTLAGTWYMTKQGVVGAASPKLSNSVDAAGNQH